MLSALSCHPLEIDFMSDLYQPNLPFSPRLRLRPSMGIVKKFLNCEFIANSRKEVTKNSVGYRTSTGRFYLSCCFHPEHTPSLCLAPNDRSTFRNGRLFYHCYGCGKSGSMERLGSIIKYQGYGPYGPNKLRLAYYYGRFNLISSILGPNLSSISDSENNTIPGGACCNKCALPVELCDCDTPF